MNSDLTAHQRIDDKEMGLWFKVSSEKETGGAEGRKTDEVITKILKVAKLKFSKSEIKY